MAREASGLLVLLGALALLASVVWLMYHPDWPPLERAESLPGVGSWVAAFRERYTPPERAQGAETAEPAIRVILQEPRPPVAGETLWLQPGATIREEPSHESGMVAVIRAIMNLRWTRRDGDWYYVESRGARPADDLAGWVFIDDPSAAMPVSDPTVEPARPLPANPIDPGILATARTLMGSDATDGRCGPYGLVTDVVDPGLARLCGAAVTKLDAAYVERLDLQPVGSPAETVLVFAEARDFAIFAGSTSRWRTESSGRASPVEGYAALAWDAADAATSSRSLVHELAHLVNRRALGPSLPPWLSEGLADDFAERLVGGKLEPAAWRVGMDRAGGELLPLSELAALGDEAFYGRRDYSNYAQALVFVRYLSGHPELRQAYGRFLAAMANGERYTPETLRRRLGRSWDELEANWDVWLGESRRRFSPFRGAGGS